LRDLLREGARALIRQAVEAEFEEHLSRYDGVVTIDGRRLVVRNGHQPERMIQTGIGPVAVKIPKARSRTGGSVAFRSALVPPYIRKTRSLEASLAWLYLKGVSTGEMSEALAALLGPGASGLSAATVARLKKVWAGEYDSWRTRRLDGRRWVYIWADGIYSGLRAEHGKLCVLVVIGVDEAGVKHLLAIEDGIRESVQSWREVLLGLKQRGMNAAKLATGDGALGFWGALEEVFPATRHQRCWMHKTGNVLNYLPKSARPKAKAALHDIWRAETREDAIAAFGLFLRTYEAKYPKAANCLEKDREDLLAFYDFPAEHWQSIRTTNPIESTFGTIRHRTKRSKGCLTRDGMLHMMFKLGQCAEKKWRKLKGFAQLGKVIAGVRFRDGTEVEALDRIAA
jgi:transposase-like protein